MARWVVCSARRCACCQAIVKSSIKTPFYSNEPISQIVSAVMFIGLCVYMWFGSLQKVKE